MTDYDSAADSREAYAFCLRIERMRLVINGDAVPRLDEPVCIITLAGLRALRKYHPVYGNG